MTTNQTRGILLASALLLGFTQPTQAQLTVTGHVQDEAGAPVALANVQLLAAADSSLFEGTIADEAGDFVLDAVKPGRYLLYVSLLGYQDYISDVLTLAKERERHVGPITLIQDAIEMEGLSVEARRALYEQRGDRLIINVGTSLTLSGATALDVLERSPGVIVDKQMNAISMLGKEGVRVMINGRLSYIPASGLLEYLAGMSADNVESIELITSPPAEFDAEGNAGYINIVLKRSPDDGVNGSFTVSGGYGSGEVGSASGNVNYQRDRVSLYGSYSFVWTGQEQFATNFRRLIQPEEIVEMPTVTRRDPGRSVHNVRVGIDYRLTGKTTVGAILAAYDNRWSMTARNELTMKTNGAPVTLIVSDNDEVNHWRHAMGNLNLRHKLGDGSTISVDLDYLRYHNENPTTYLNTSTDVASGEVTQDLLESGKVTPLGIAVGKVDYTWAAGERWEFGTGAKAALSRFTNEADFAGLVRDEWVSEIGLASKSRLREDVYALYGRADYKVGESASLKAGLRYELTDSNLGSDEAEDLVDRRFGSLFPSLAYSNKLTDAHQIDASYTRRITRPSFSDMAPFLYFADPYTFFTGNVALQPAIINTLKLDYTFKNMLVSLQYAWEDSSIARFQSRVLAEENVQLFFSTNLRRTQVATAMIALPVRVTPWWSTQNNALLTWQQADGYMDEVPFTLSRNSVQFNSTQNVNLPHDFSFEATGFYRSATLSGSWRVRARWGMNVGLQRTLPDGKGRLTFAVNDVFNSAEWSGTVGLPGDPIYQEQLLDLWHRTFTLTYSTRFGDGKAARSRSTASQEESQRVQ